MISITQLEYVLAVDRERHFGKAARACYVSQPSLSAQLQKLEDELETVIFDRSKKPILVTEVGKLIIEQAKVILQEHRKLQTIVDQQAIVPQGEFRLGVIPTLAMYIIPRFLHVFAENFPKVKLYIDEYKTEDIVRLLINDEIDAGLLVTPLEDERLIERHSFYEPFYCYLNENHSLMDKSTLSASDLNFEELWLLAEGHCFRDQVLNVCSTESNTKKMKNIRFESGSLDTLIKLVKRNAGFTLLPQLAVNELTQQEVEKHVKSFQQPIPTREVSLVYSRSFLKESIISALEQSILTNLPNGMHSLKKKQMKVISF